MLDQKPMVSGDEERGPLMTEAELRDGLRTCAATIVIAFLFGCEFEHCWLNDDGYKWPLRLSSVELKYPPNPSLASVAAIHEAGAWPSPSGMAAGIISSAWSARRTVRRPRFSTTLGSGKRSRPSPSSSGTTTAPWGRPARAEIPPRSLNKISASLSGSSAGGYAAVRRGSG
jgi:hypothetical protein